MPLFAPSTGGGITPLVVYAECNSPAGSGGDDPLVFDTYYNGAQADITVSKTAALAAIGLTVAADEFTATAAGIWALALSFEPVEAPALQASSIELFLPDYMNSPAFHWGVGGFGDNPPSNDDRLVGLFYAAASDTFHVRTVATGTVSDGVVTYAAMSIIRLA